MKNSIAKKQIDNLLNEANKIAMKEVERLARKVMKERPNLKTFCMAMGGICFYDKDGPLRRMDNQPYTRTYLKPIESFVEEFDYALKLTGQGLRLDSHAGPVITDW